MDRRNLLKTGLAAGAAYMMPWQKAVAGQIDQRGTRSPGESFAHIMLGDLQLTVLSDGHIFQQPVQPFIAPGAPEQEVKKLLYDHFRPVDQVDLAMNVLLIKTSDRLVMLDTGMGIFADAETGHLLGNLKAAGHKPEDVTDIFISHAHPDHIGGVINRANEFVFPNAGIFISEIEYKFWEQASLKDFSKSEMRKQPDFVNQLLPPLKNLLKVIRPKVQFYQKGKPMYDIFSFELVPGHTPGMVATTISSDTEKLVYAADLLHHDILLFAHPEWGFSGDTDLELATATRKKVLATFQAGRTYMAGFHLPWPGLGYVGKRGGAYQWFPKAFSRL